MEIKIDAPFDEAAEFFDEIGSKVFPQVEASAQNEAAAQSKTRIARKVRDRTGVPIREINKRMKLHRRRRGYTKTARIFIGTVAVAAFPNLRATELKRGGISYAGAGGRVRDSHAFIAKNRWGQTRALRRTSSDRYPLKHITVPVADAARRASEEVLRDFYPGTFERLLASKFSYRFSQAAQKRQRIRLL